MLVLPVALSVNGNAVDPPIIDCPFNIAAMLCVLSLSLLRAFDQSSDTLDCLGEPFCGDPLPVGEGVFEDTFPSGLPKASVGTLSCDV